MTSVLKVDTLQNLNSSTIITQTNATTITLGISGQTISIPAGATINTSTINVTTVVLAAGAVGTPSLTTSSDTNTGIFFPTADTIAFTEGGAEAMRIDSSGRVCIGTTTGVYALTVGTTSNSQFVLIRGMGISYPDSAIFMGVGANHIGLGWDSPNIFASVDNAVSAVIGTASDYRLKNNNNPLQNGLDTILALRPITYNPVEFDGTVYTDRIELGLIAHEVQLIRPSVVTGIKDEVNEEGKPKYQSVNYAGLVPDLIKAIQEQQAIIEELKTRITTLENK